MPIRVRGPAPRFTHVGKSKNICDLNSQQRQSILFFFHVSVQSAIILNFFFDSMFIQVFLKNVASNLIEMDIDPDRQAPDPDADPAK